MHFLGPASAYRPAGHDATHALVAGEKKYGLGQEEQVVADEQVRHVVSQGWQVPVPSS
jgi:hypothetical protein